MLINIKNMVCQRCEIIVNNILTNLGLDVAWVTKGQAMIKGRVLQYQLRLLDNALKETGLEIIIDKKSLLIQKVKNIIHETVYWDAEPPAIKFSCYLSQRLNYSYTYLANLFSQQCHMTIERYIIEQRIEKVKTMLVAENYILSEIASKMNYSSVAHLSAQFKKVTGITASDYKAMQGEHMMRLSA
ncbi:helix-turn-helix domain-containing protein [Ferruginibacter sp. SUN106]|uniref:helix-turn-helix domain-containing protein n=1 Tax=Ferruginibacter sp. SUN106 TaxID=2978348 RepID=UPI003D3636FC